MNTSKDKKTKTPWTLFGALAAAIAASICCVGPLVLLGLGVGGAWVGNLKMLEPYRPIFMLLSLGLLAFGFYRVYRKAKPEDCQDGSYCASPKSNRINKIGLWLALILIVSLFAYPYVAARVASCCTSASQKSTLGDLAVLNVEGMTCAGCTVTVTKSLKGLDGVHDVRVTLDPPRAIVQYDPTIVSVKDMTNATSQAGYPTSLDVENTAKESSP